MLMSQICGCFTFLKMDLIKLFRYLSALISESERDISDFFQNRDAAALRPDFGGDEICHVVAVDVTCGAVQGLNSRRRALLTRNESRSTAHANYFKTI